MAVAEQEMQKLVDALGLSHSRTLMGTEARGEESPESPWGGLCEMSRVWEVNRLRTSGTFWQLDGNDLSFSRGAAVWNTAPTISDTRTV